jgi:hypothetical protein
LHLSLPVRNARNESGRLFGRYVEKKITVNTLYVKWYFGWGQQTDAEVVNAEHNPLWNLGRITCPLLRELSSNKRHKIRLWTVKKSPGANRIRLSLTR